MAGADITRLMNEARTQLPGAIDSAMQLALFTVMDEFFKGTNAWMEDIPFDVVGSSPSGTIYEIVPTGPATIDKLMWVFEQPTSDSEIRGAPVNAYMSTPGELVLRLQPSENKTYIATVALTVQDPVTRDGYVIFPAWVVAKYRQHIIDGLLGKMMSQPNKPYTDKQLSVYHLRRFLGGIGEAKVEVQRNQMYRAQAWVFPRFASGSQRSGSRYFPPQ